MTAPLFVELCAGTATLAAAFRALGWRTLTVDADPQHGCDITADVCALSPDVLGEVPAFVHASPPCPEFSRHSMPWTRARNPPPPDMRIVRACVSLCRAWQPTVGWSVENVRGAVPFFRADGLGEPSAILGSFYLWGSVPPIAAPRYPRDKERRSSADRIGRASFPEAVARAIAESVDRERRLFGRMQAVAS